MTFVFFNIAHSDTAEDSLFINFESLLYNLHVCIRFLLRARTLTVITTTTDGILNTKRF